MPRQVRLLLIEDNPHVADLIRDGLDGAARRALAGQVTFECEVCQDGQMALDKLKTMAPDLIICDVYMPVMDGAAFIKRLRAAPDTAKTPVIALSAGGPAARESALAAGANVFLDKPIRLNEVLAAALQLLPS